MLRPIPAAQAAGMLVHPPLVIINGGSSQDFQVAIPIQVVHPERAQLMRWRGLDRPDQGSKVGIDADIPALCHHNFQVAVCFQVRQDNIRPDAPAGRVNGGLLECPCAAVQDEQGICPGNHFRLPISVQVGNCRGGIPARFTPGTVASAMLPLQHRRGNLSLRAGCGGRGGQQECNHNPACQQLLHGRVPFLPHCSRFWFEMQ